MSKRHGGTGGSRRRSFWTVLIPGQTGPADDDGKRIHVRPQSYTFDNKKRAQRFAGNVQGSKMVPAKRFWTLPRVLLLALAVGLVVICLF